MTEWTKEQQKANRAKLVKALRSGEYEQCRERLHSKDGRFSCLGVAVDLAIKEGVVSDWVMTRHGCYACEKDAYIMPDNVRKWLGLKGRFGRYTIDDMMFYLGEDNDYGVSFSELAEIIESEPKNLIGLDLHDRHRTKY